MDFREAFSALRVLTVDCEPRAECQLADSVDVLNCYAGRTRTAEGPIAEATTLPSCFESDSAYVNGTINVRTGAGTSFAKVDIVTSSTVSVLETSQQANYCWLRIGENRWIAKTHFVLAADTPALKATATPSSVSQAQACYPHSSAYVNGTINVRNGAGADFSLVGVKRQEQVSVLASQRSADYCWLQIGANSWIAWLSHVLAQKPVAAPAQPASQPASQPPSQPVSQPAAPQPAQPTVLSFRTCSDAKAAGYSNFPTGSIAITSPRSHRGDRDGNGIACES